MSWEYRERLRQRAALATQLADETVAAGETVPLTSVPLLEGAVPPLEGDVPPGESIDGEKEEQSFAGESEQASSQEIPSATDVESEIAELPEAVAKALLEVQAIESDSDYAVYMTNLQQTDAALFDAVNSILMAKAEKMALETPSTLAVSTEQTAAANAAATGNTPAPKTSKKKAAKVDESNTTK
jgi:hypothetical protein